MMKGFLKQVNRSNGGLPKLSVAGPVMMTVERIEGDRWRNLRFHGGPLKAVLMASAELVDRLAAAGYPVTYGSLGENLTVSGFDPHSWRSGQRFRIGAEAEIQLTKLRTPCANLDVYGPSIKDELYDELCHAGDTTSPNWAHGGFYARVLRPGQIAAGDVVELQ